MNVEDESLLSAYLDNELTPAQRLSVEDALLADARLAERLQQLAAVRSTIAGLPRPLVGRDISSLVVERAEALPVVRFRRMLDSGSTRRRLTLTGSCFGAAAAVLLAASLWPVRPQPGAGLDFANGTTPSAEVATNGAATVDGPEPLDSQLAQAETTVHRALEPTPAPDATPGDSEDLDKVREYLGRGDVRRLMVVLDTITPSSLEQVRGAIQETGRADPILGELRIAQGIEIDPERPEDAVVFLVVLDDHEFHHLSENLRRHNLEPDLDERALASDVVTQLASRVDVVNLSPGLPAPALRPVPHESLGPLHLATKAAGELGTDGAPARGDQDDAERPVGEADPAVEDVLPVSPATPSQPTDRVYLVWIATPRPDNHSAPL